MKIKKFDSMNVIPFIDIMLVLLAIVLMFSTFLAEGKLDLKLPSSSSSKAANEKFVTIFIDRNGLIKVDSEEVDMDSLKGELSTLSKNSNISLRADEHTPFKTFVSVVDILKQLELEKISIITRMEQ